MNPKWLFFLLMAIGSLAHGAAADPSAFGGKRPQNGIYDPAGWIPGIAKGKLAQELVSIKESSGLDILVVVEEDLQGNDPQILADELANRWGYAGGRALILHVPKNPESPWIVVSGLIRSELPAPVLEKIIQKAENRARSSPGVQGAVVQAVDSLADDLRFLSGRSARGLQPAGKVAPSDWKGILLRIVEHYRILLLILVIVVTALLLAVMGGIRLWRNFRLSFTPKTFPEISWKPRFGAPYAGIVYTHSVKKRRPTP